MRVNKQAVLKLLDASGISYESVEHEAVFKFGQKNLVSFIFTILNFNASILYFF